MPSNGLPEIRTQRLLLRRWCEADRAPFAAMNAGPRVMEHFPKLLAREESDAMVARIEAHLAQHGYAQWAVEIPGVTSFAGFVGLSVPRFEEKFTPCVEVGWRRNIGAKAMQPKERGRRWNLASINLDWRRYCRLRFQPICGRDGSWKKSA